MEAEFFNAKFSEINFCNILECVMNISFDGI